MKNKKTRKNKKYWAKRLKYWSSFNQEDPKIVQMVKICKANLQLYK